MSYQRTLHRVGVAVLLLAAFLFQETWALAGVTGNMSGSVRDSTGAPVAGATVTATSPSMTRTATTDAGGHFVILSLAPDTYTVNLDKSGFQPLSFPGNVVFADQTDQVAFTMTKTLKTIARVTSQAGSSLVKSGVGGDLYSVNATQAAAAAALGGGGNLNNTYSAMGSVPGVQVSMGGMGWDFNAAYVRGQNSYYTGFEYDGIPVNRAFDNYNSSTESSLGLQELQVYTGGGPASVASAGTAGFVNQVIKTGTFPGFGIGNLGVGYPQFYHQAQVEVGGSTPDRNFSYYAAFSGYNQEYRVLDNSNGAGYMTPGGPFAGPTLGLGIGYGSCFTATCQGVKSTCPLVGSPSSTLPQGCWTYYSGLTSNPTSITDRESVINLHFGIPRKNGLRDDIQTLWSASSLANYFSYSPDQVGPGNSQTIFAAFGTHAAAPLCGPETIAPGLTVNGCASVGGAPTYIGYPDGVAYNVPFGTPIATPTKTRAPGVYMAPDTPAHDFQGPLPLNDQWINALQNNTGVTKLQYTHALSQSAYLRAYGYTFYSNWLQQAPIYGGSFELITNGNPSPQYQLITHTAGGALSFQDQINDKNLISLDGNYTSASVIRFNNTSALGVDIVGGSPIGYMAKRGNGPLSNAGFTCYDPSSGMAQACLTGGYCDPSLSTPCSPSAPNNAAPTWRSSATAGPAGFAAPGSPAARAGATWDSLWQGNANGSFNTVRPRFTNASLADQFRPNDKILINAALRYDNFTYDLPDSGGIQNAFYSNLLANYSCVQAATNQVLLQPLAPGQPPPAAAQYVLGDCNAAVAQIAPGSPHTGWVHPNGKTQNGVAAPNFTAESPASYSLDYWQPRFSATYTQSPNVVWRVSAGRYTQPPISASVQYLALAGDDRSVWTSTMPLGFYSPFHPIPGISSGQYDISYEQHFKGTDMSMKVSPFYTWVSGWQQQIIIGANFVTQVPVGVNKNEGVEFQFNKGDFSRDGLSGQFAFTYTNSKVMFQNVPTSGGGFVPNQTTVLNEIIKQYNGLTKAGGGSPCYQGGLAVSCSTRNGKVVSGMDTVLNPYYNQPAQGLLDPGGWYNPYTVGLAPGGNGASTSYISPYVSSLILNYRHKKLAVTPSLVFQSGSWYGSPLDVTGVDPRVCTANSASTGITKVSPHTNPLQCNYLSMAAPGAGQFAYLYIPNPQTGMFAFDSFLNPNSLAGNLQVTYDLTPKIKLSLLGVTLFHACFGGTSTPWSAAYPPNNVICGYGAAGGPLNSTVYPANFYNGTGINDVAANKTRAAYPQSYTPGTSNNGAIGGAPLPINLYFNATVKI